MKNVISTLISLSTCSLFCLLFVGTTVHAASHTVAMKSISYDPKKIEIKPGDTVDWANGSYTEHSATADDGKGFDTGMVEPKKTSKKITFKNAGTYNYHCSVHGKTMSGQVVVQP